MALKAIMLRKKLNDAQKALDALREKDAEFEKREAELEASIEETTTQEERDAVDGEIEKFEAEKKEHEEAKEKLEAEVRELEQSLADEEAAQDTQTPAPVAPVEEKREEIKTMSMNRRTTMFGKSEQERSAFFEREDVKAYLGEVRAAMKEKRALTNVGLTIPEVFLGILRENLMDYSKLYKHVNVKPLSGDGRQIIQGTVPEAVWTECCANLNELDLGFNDVEVGCNKVAGFFAICNAVLEDSDVDLAAELVTALGQSIGLALDKAILYGTGNHMPLGIVTRLAQTSQPASYPATARTWVDLHTSNIKTIANSVTGIALFQAFMINSAAAKRSNYGRGEKVWVMNELTYNWMMAQSMSIDASGAIVAGVNGRMPVVGGIIEVLDFVPNYVIVGGYMDLYLLAERSGKKFAQSEHVRFLNDQTVFKGTARYDGQPAIAEAFVAIGVNSAEPSDSMSFAGDTANSVQGVKISKTTLTVADGATAQLKAETYPVKGTITWASSNTTYASVSTNGVVTGEAEGSAIITATCGEFSASCEVTVTA